MSLGAIFGFLIPAEGFQWIFLCLIFGLAASNWHFVRRSANTKTWEDNWKHATSGGFDTEHGSVHDISEAVASRAERLAESMPGILLIVGLLGTFIGLGIALDRAADVVTAQKGIDELVGTMDGLGTKFKTSTWGILSFLIFKAWVAVSDFDGKRMRWCAAKMREQLDQRRAAQSQKEDQFNQRMANAIRDFGNQVALSIVKTGNSDRVILQESRDSLAGIAKDMLGLQTAMTGFLDANTQNLITIQSSAAQMGDAAKQVGGAATGLGDVVAQLKDGLEKSISDMNSAIEKNLDTVSSTMKAATDGVKDSAEKLDDSIRAIKTELSVSIAEMGGQLAGAAGEIKTAVNALPASVDQTMDKIIGAVDSMQANFSKNLETIDQSLTKATTDISSAISSVPQAMNEVREAIAKSVEIQTRANGKFNATSDSLRTTVDVMTAFVKDLGGDIKLGLGAISDTALKIGHLKDNFTAITDSAKTNAETNAASMQALVDTMNEVADGLAPLQKMVQTFKEDSAWMRQTGTHATGNIDNALSRLKTIVDQQEKAVVVAEQNLAALTSLSAAISSGFSPDAHRQANLAAELELPAPAPASLTPGA